MLHVKKYVSKISKPNFYEKFNSYIIINYDSTTFNYSLCKKLGLNKAPNIPSTPVKLGTNLVQFRG